MSAGFSGWPEEALDLYEGLEADNSKAYWTDHKPVYDACVRAPFDALVAELAPEFGAFKVFRPYRDVRFSKDKTPYKDHQGAVREQGPGALYVQLSASGLLVAGGGYALAKDQARRLRAAVADDAAGRALVRLLAELEAAGYEVGGERLTRTPPEHKGVLEEDDPRSPLLRARTLVASRHWPPQPWLHTPEALEVVRRGLRALLPLDTWLRDHLAAPGG